MVNTLEINLYFCYFWPCLRLQRYPSCLCLYFSCTEIEDESRIPQWPRGNVVLKLAYCYFSGVVPKKPGNFSYVSVHAGFQSRMLCYFHKYTQLMMLLYFRIRNLLILNSTIKILNIKPRYQGSQSSYLVELLTMDVNLIISS